MTQQKTNFGEDAHATKAQVLWNEMNVNEKTVVRFGMFPVEKMSAAEQEGYNSQQLAVALMTCAKADGGMRA